MLSALWKSREDQCFAELLNFRLSEKRMSHAVSYSCHTIVHSLVIFLLILIAFFFHNILDCDLGTTAILWELTFICTKKWAVANITCKIRCLGLGISFQSTISAENVENIILFPISSKAYKNLKLTHHFGWHLKFYLKRQDVHDHVW